MANPNLNSATNVYAVNTQLSLTTTNATQLISNPANSGKVFLIDSIVVANTDTAANSVAVSLVRYNSATNTGTAYPIASTISIPANASLIVIGTENKINLTENESIYVTAVTANKLMVDANWKELS